MVEKNIIKVHKGTRKWVVEVVSSTCGALGHGLLHTANCTINIFTEYILLHYPAMIIKH